MSGCERCPGLWEDAARINEWQYFLVPVYHKTVPLFLNKASYETPWPASGLSAIPNQYTGTFTILNLNLNAPLAQTVEVRSRAPEGERGYTLYLGRYPIKTPGRNLLVLPTLPLALAVAAEWEWQVRGGGGQWQQNGEEGWSHSGSRVGVAGEGGEGAIQCEWEGHL